MLPRVLGWLLSGVFVLSPFLVAARERDALAVSRPAKLSSKQVQMLNDLGFIQNLFLVTYAPLQWKKNHFGFSLDEEVIKAQQVVKGNRSITTKDFQGLIKNLCNAVKDYHVVTEFYSTETATLPFCIQSAEGRYYISYVDEKAFKNEPPPFCLGDEVLYFNSMPVEKVVDGFRSEEIGSNYYGTDKALAELYFTTRLGSLGHTVSEGSVHIVCRRQDSGRLQTHELEWDYYPELISSALKVPMITPVPSKSKKHFSEHPYFHRQFITPHYKALSAVRMANSEPSVMLGAKRSMLPALGEILWETDDENEFHAYLFNMSSGKVGGYIRVPTYHTNGKAAAKEFADIVKVFEERADILVVDQMNNPGGSILYLYSLLSMLADRPLEVPQHRIKITQDDVYFAANEIPFLKAIADDKEAIEAVGGALDGVFVDYQLIQSLLRSFCFILDQWDAGKLFTDFHSLYGIDKVMPNPDVHYTKPILVLVNSLAFSGGDFFPAIMQDNSRATIMGTRTAGAGGYIEKIAFPNLSGIEEIDLTASFAERPGRRPIENYGVTPDILYEVSAIDLQNNYIEYVERIQDELDVMLRA